MRRVDIDIPIYGYTLTVVTIYDKNDEQSVRDLYKELGIDFPQCENDFENIREERFDGGESYTFPGDRIGLILIYKFEDVGRFINVLNHEKRHFIDRIAQAHGFSDEMECCAYLDGYISEQIYNHIKELI